MKLRITFKTPDTVDEALATIEDPEMAECFRDLARKFFDYGEYVTVELDSDTGECEVVESK